ncbi:MAG: hypothetical protein GY822_00890 [Deltaproteobacteria bacterium]|nr:hypothetical protein [Deltaproteobacteria bacterium]
MSNRSEKISKSFLRLPMRAFLVGGVFFVLSCTSFLAFSQTSSEKKSAQPKTIQSENVSINDSTKADIVYKRSAAFRRRQPRLLQSIPFQKTPEGLPDLRAATCGACHQEIYKEWQISTHALALHGDPQFIAEVEKNNRGEKKAGWVCMNCHTPLENQQPELVVGLRDERLGRPVMQRNPNYDAALREEAITCATCHVRDGVIHGPFGDTNAPHPTAKDPNLAKSTLCTQCHQAMGSFPKEDLLCAFSTGEEHEKSPQAKEDMTCQSCHMPVVERPLMAGFPARKTRRHFFMGSLLPKTYADVNAIDKVRPFFQQGLQVTLPQKIRNENATQKVVVKYKNEFAGHLLPTGDPERFLIIDAKVTSLKGLLLTSQKVRIGTVYEWYPTAKKLSDNRLRPKEERILELSFAPQREPISIHVVVTKGRITQENLAYHHLEKKVVGEQVIYSEKRVLP